MALKQLQPEAEATRADHRGILPLVLAVLFFLALALFLVWLNIERTKLAYSVQTLQTEVDARGELHSKLLVERDHLLSPQQLGNRAATMGLQIAKPGQIRRMDPSPAANKTSLQGK